MLRAGWTTATLVATMLLVTGCGTFYSETRDKQGKAVMESWQKVDVASQVATARKNHAALLAKQLEVQDTLLSAKRDQLARSMATGKTVREQLQQPVRAALAALAGSKERAKEWSDALDKQDRAHSDLEDFETEFTRFGLEMPPCEKLDETRKSIEAAVRGQPAEAIGVTLDRLSKHCRQPAMSAADDLKLPEGALRAARDDVKKGEGDLARLRARGVSERNAFRVAKAAYEAAAEKLKSDSNARGEVQAAAEKLKAAAAALAGLQDAFSVEFLSKEQRDSLDRFLTTVLETPARKTPPADASKAAVALVIVPDLIDSARASLAEAQKASLVPFVVAKDLAQITAEAAEKDIKTQETAVAILREKLTWQSRRTRNLADAAILLEGGPAPDGKPPLVALASTVLGADFYDALAPLDARPKSDDAAGMKKLDNKLRLWKAAALYLDAEGRIAAEVGKSDYRINALRHEVALTYAESSINQWNVLISSAVGQLADYGAAGIKKEDLVALLNSLTLLWIGKGVN